MKYFKRIIIALVYLLPAALYCSYYPIIKLGENGSMNFELSLPLIWLVIFDIISFIALIIVAIKNHGAGVVGTPREKKTRRSPKASLTSISDRKFFLFSLFPFYATISAFWSPNPVRAILTAGIIWLVFFAIFSLFYILPLLNPPSNFRRNCLASFFFASVVACLICWIQSLLDIAGVARETTLMCRGCTYLSFGFPHPSGLAIEPQFMGNLLLAPTLTSLYLLIFGKIGDSDRGGRLLISEGSGVTTRSSARHPRRRAVWTRLPKLNNRLLLTLLCILFSSTLFLTFSRGAIYAYAIALLALLIFAVRRHVFHASLVVIPVFTFLLVTGIQGIFTVIGPTHGSFLDGVSKSVHQLSLGIIDIRPKNTPELQSDPSQDTPSNSSDVSESTDQALVETDVNEPENTQDQPFFDGYVAESTNARLDLNQAAIDTWLSAPGHPESGISIGLHCHFFLPGTGPACTASAPLTPTSVLFGVGLGGAGTAMYLNSFITGINSPKEIVQHQGFSLLLELGLVGIALIIFSLLVAFFPQIFPSRFLDGKSAHAGKVNPSAFWQHPALPLLVSLIIAYLITLNFFSGLPNALQIYLIPPLLYIIFRKNSCVTRK